MVVGLRSGGYSFRVLAMLGKGFIMRIILNSLVVEIIWIELFGLDKKSGIKFVLPFMCLTEKSYLENQSLSLRI